MGGKGDLDAEAFHDVHLGSHQPGTPDSLESCPPTASNKSGSAAGLNGCERVANPMVKLAD
jgi:hypothetical protein